MQSISFPEATGVLGAPTNWEDHPIGKTEPCRGLSVYCDGTQYISCWDLTWRERLRILFGGYVWLYIVGAGHPVVGMNAAKTVFTKEDI